MPDLTRVTTTEKFLAGAFASRVLVARIPPEDMPLFANDDGVVEIELRRDDGTGRYEPEADTRARLLDRLAARGGFRVVTDDELEAELAEEASA